MSADDDARGTPVQGLPIFASLATVENMRQEQSVLKERVIKMEGTVESHSKSLNSGAETFTKIEQQIEAVNKRVNPTWPALIAVAMTLGGIIWVAARYPDPQKFEALQNQVQQLQIKQVEVNADLAGIHKALDSIESRNTRIEQKLDDALNKARP
jgi:DNA-binding FrmR family transcriptional regulator